MRLPHTWVTTARLTHSYMYAGYSWGGGGLTHTSIYARCRFLYGLGQGLGAGLVIRGWVRVRANAYICGDVKHKAFGYNCLSSQN